ncbi:MAG: class II fructose-bisphosphate aldolase [Nitrososphaeria archaeon]|jgi:fructose-bisphosphate aldolase class II
MLESTKEMLEKAKEEKYGIGLFVIFNLSFIKPVIEAAEEAHSPVMIGATYGLAEASGGESFLAHMRVAAEEAKIPVTVHLDHGKTFEQVMACLKYGWTSMMFDAANKPLKENIQLTREVARACHAAGVPIEAELGEMPVVKDQNKAEFPKEMMTKPEEAEIFVKETGIDILAISIGQIHHFPQIENGMHPVKRVAKLDFERLKKIRDVTGNTYLCMHAGSHVPFEALEKAISMGIVKLNIGTALSSVWTDTLRKTIIENPNEVMAQKIVDPAEKAVKKEVSEYLKVLGSAGKV